jgi:hypothetical protein
MPSIVYAGVRYTQTRHAIKCKKCLETIESKHRHYFKHCSCGAVGIDGGISNGNRILGNMSDIEVCIVRLLGIRKYGYHNLRLKNIFKPTKYFLQCPIKMPTSLKKCINGQ